MLTTILFIAEIHFNQLLLVLSGYFIAAKFLNFELPANTNEISKKAGFSYLYATRVSATYICGFLYFSLLGALLLIVKWPGLTIWGPTILLLLFSIKTTQFNIKRIFLAYRNYCLYPFLAFLPFALYLLLHFSPTEINSGIDPWTLIARTQSYYVPDHYLQWTVSENFFAQQPLERYFNSDGLQMWSAGDRPVLVGLLEATFSQLTKNRSITLYYLRVILMASMLFTALFTLMKVEFGIESILKRATIILTIALNPFFLINTIFTWPKMAGLAFGMLGFLILSVAINEKKQRTAIIAGVAFSLGMLCHTAALFCLLCAFLYFPLAWKLENYKEKIQFYNFSKFALAFLAPIIILTQIHSRLVASVTNQTNLLARVQLCRGGSYAFITPIESVLESCKKYYEKQGLSGIISDRIKSLGRAFDFNPTARIRDFLAVLKGETSFNSYFHSLHSPMLLLVPDTIGQFSLWFLFVFICLYIIGLKLPKFGFDKKSLVMPIGFIFLLLFSCMLGEYTEMSSHVVPFIIPLFIHLGILMELSRFTRIILFSFSTFSIFFYLGVLYSH